MRVLGDVQAVLDVILDPWGEQRRRPAASPPPPSGSER